jgi:predicted DNA-binding transcriptional regulator AlpA
MRTSSRLPKVRGDNLIVTNLPMCDDLGCPSRTNCFRHIEAGRVPRAQNQPYFAEPVRARDEDHCAFYWPIRPKGIRMPRIRRVTIEQQYTIRSDPSQMKMLLTAIEVARMFAVTKPTIDSWLKRHDLNFPKPFKIGNKNRMWYRSDIDTFIRSDALRGVGARGRHAWLGGTADNPAYPWVHIAPEQETPHERPADKTEHDPPEGGSTPAAAADQPPAHDPTADPFAAEPA